MTRPPPPLHGQWNCPRKGVPEWSLGTRIDKLRFRNVSKASYGVSRYLCNVSLCLCIVSGCSCNVSVGHCSVSFRPCNGCSHPR